MGLDAVVYFRKENIKNIDKAILQTDEDTGEIYIENSKGSGSFPDDIFMATHKRLGNIAAISKLRDNILPVLGKTSILLSKILSSPSHSGDLIGMQDLNNLEYEMNILRKKFDGNPPEVVSNFLKEMKDLIKVAREQGNPIVFV
jgi:hypothetical protein